MKSIDEMCAVMQAFKEGKTIEFKDNRSVGNEWKRGVKPTWDWNYFDYRVKPEPKYVPYDSVTEVEKDKWIMRKGSNIIDKITSIDREDNTVYYGVWEDLQHLFEKYTYEDGTPCGKLVEE